MKPDARLRLEARRLVSLLLKRDQRLVLAESCTGGLVAATLARIPGVSETLCGSAVTYRNQTKAGWLGIPAKLLSNPGPVSGLVARKMAEGVLARTAEATLSAAVTGHLGPDAPEGFDGRVFVAVTFRRPRGFTTEVQELTVLPQRRTKGADRTTKDQGRRLRERRQLAASLSVFLMVRSLLKSDPT